MPVRVNLDVMLAKRKMRSKTLAELVGISEQNLSLLKSGKVKGVRFSTLEAICQHLHRRIKKNDHATLAHECAVCLSQHHAAKTV